VEMSSLTSVELNFLVFRYLQESGTINIDFLCSRGFFCTFVFEFVCVPVATG
jgi:hypothetical protein